ncbi:hypothetical protein Misp01_61670 [Microtetraspora sp. NBRC 13810]|uniref:hypothetical protein n=1 Tax=Microtetraspora sp. NBRC 13810 TaxID=3030990 RepID=UPI0024A4B624|nr:hypothetical protein [Microtetraspora sp. NBRC 13810]GLW11039.1 hypothetical protein Misp01_61670 [Microtetraspora sp. NBRC 13810]
MMSIIQDVVVQLAIGAVPLGVAWFAYRSATDANRKTAESSRAAAEQQAQLERSKVDVEAFSRAEGIYNNSLNLLERQLARSQEQIVALEQAVAVLRAQLIQAGIPPDPRTTVHITISRE